MTRPALWPSLLPPSQHGNDDLCLESASGVRLRFTDGTERLCGTSGLWNANLGYGNPVIADAVAKAMRDASYLGTFRWENTYVREAAELLREACGAEHFSRIIFSTSGGAANDLTMKVARHYHALRGEPQRRLVVGLRHGYHGLTFGSFALTSDDLGQRTYGVDTRLVRHVNPNDTRQLEKLLSREGAQTAAVVIEPQLGTGAIPLTEQYVADLLRLRAEYGFLLVADEVATGFGRLGTFFASEAWPARPDLMVTSKGLTNGTSAAAALAVSEGVWEPFAASDAVLGHAETQAGTAVTAAAIIATIGQMAELDALSQARRVASRMDDELARLLAEEPAVEAVSGTGCFRAVTLNEGIVKADGGRRLPQLWAEIRRAGAIVHPGPAGFQLVPALVYTDAELDELFDCVRAGLASFAELTPAAR